MPMTPKAIIEELRRLTKEIEGYTHLDTPNARSLSRMAATSPKMVAKAILALDNSMEMRQLLGLDPNELRAEVEALTDWNEVERALDQMHRGVAYAQLIRRHQLGLATSQVFQIARQLIRHPRNADLIPYVEFMRSENKFGRRKKPKPESEPVSE